MSEDKKISARRALQNKVDAVRVAHCETLSDCADCLHGAETELVADCETLMQVFTAVSQRLATLELEKIKESMRGEESDLPDEATFSIHRQSLALTAHTSSARQRARREGGVSDSDDAAEETEEEESEPQLQQLALPQLRIALGQSSVVPFTPTPITSAASVSAFMRLLQGAHAVKVNQKNLGTSKVYLYLSVEGATAESPGTVCARKKDGSIT